MPKFNHAYDFTYEIISEKEDASDVTPEMFATAFRKRIEDLDSEGDLAWQETMGAPFDTYEMEEGT
jgi:hypothetical protein